MDGPQGHAADCLGYGTMLPVTGVADSVQTDWKGRDP